MGIGTATSWAYIMTAAYVKSACVKGPQYYSETKGLSRPKHKHKQQKLQSNLTRVKLFNLDIRLPFQWSHYAYNGAERIAMHG